VQQVLLRFAGGNRSVCVVPGCAVPVFLRAISVLISGKSVRGVGNTWAGPRLLIHRLTVSVWAGYEMQLVIPLFVGNPKSTLNQ